MTPRWDGKRWIIQEMRDGVRHTFSCSTPGRQGLKEVRRKYELWLLGEGSGHKTVAHIAEEYLEDLKARRGSDAECVIQSERYIRLYIAPVCGSRKICKMTLREWQSVINGATGRNNKTLSHKTLENLRGTISALVKFAYEDYQCEPLRGDLYIPQGHSRKEKEILQREDVNRLFEQSDKWYHPLFCFLVITGMRPGEALGLQVSDIRGDTITIQRAVNYRGKITEGKNENARRVIPIGQTARQILDDTIARNERYNLRTEWIFCDKYGGPGNQSTMRNQWNELKRERNLPGTVYSLRHTFISLMKNTMPEQMIKDIVGHSTAMPTFSVYGHHVTEDSKRAADIIDLTFRDAKNDANLSASGGLSPT